MSLWNLIDSHNMSIYLIWLEKKHHFFTRIYGGSEKRAPFVAPLQRNSGNAGVGKVIPHDKLELIDDECRA